jgi:hypothetical protein
MLSIQIFYLFGRLKNQCQSIIQIPNGTGKKNESLGFSVLYSNLFFPLEKTQSIDGRKNYKSRFFIKKGRNRFFIHHLKIGRPPIFFFSSSNE